MLVIIPESSPDNRFLFDPRLTLGQLVNPTNGSNWTRLGFGDDVAAASQTRIWVRNATLCCKGSRQPIEITANATALRAHHKPTFGAEIATTRTPDISSGEGEPIAPMKVICQAKLGR